MSIARIPLWLSVLTLVAGISTQANAQFPTTTHQFGGAGFWEPDHLGLVNPQIPLNYFEPDFQFFAPADVSTFGGYPEPNIGFFFSYDRLYWNVQRSETDAAPYEGDFTWGNRVDFGYMMETGHGWLLSAYLLDGPNVYRNIDFFFQEDTDGDGNDERVTQTESENNADFEGVEVNKTFRWKPVGKNYIIEPMIGARFMRFTDYDFVTELIENIDDDGVVVSIQPPFTDRTIAENNILGGQLGVRIHHQTERWVTSVESKFVPAINYQFYTNPIFFEENEDYSEFTIFGQVRMTATYKLTRDISIGTGFDIMHFGRGIARGRNFETLGDRRINLPQNDQDLTIGGFSMLFQLNR
jgi:hypothetical protein